jgi:CPA2 family monovalent cation:H+ antiporter-2
VTAETPFFRDLAYVFLAALLGGGLARLLRQPLILGYVFGGLLVNPLTPGPAVSDIHALEVFAEIGVILLMFSVGLEFSFRDLLRVRAVALVGGPLGILGSVALGLLTGRVLGWPLATGMTVGIVTSVASTMVLARLLLDRGELHTVHGRVMVGITLVEDLAVVVLVALMPAIGALEPARLAALGLGLARAAVVLVPVAILARRVVPSVMTRVARTRDPELFLMVALAIGLGTAALSQAVGLSLALGAFLAGLVIGESDYAAETLARVLPLRDAFVALFFVTVGGLIAPAALLANFQLLVAMVVLIVGGKLILWALVVRAFRYPWATAWRVGAGLGQIGEFSFILVQASRAAGHVGSDVYNATLAASLVTILLNALVVRLSSRWVDDVGAAAPPLAAAVTVRRGHVVVCGFGRVGGAVGASLETFGIPYVAIESDPDIVRALRARGVECLFGDGSARPLLEAAAVGEAALVVVALPVAEHARFAVSEARALNATAPILARAAHADGARALQAAGATAVILPELEAARALIEEALRHLDLPAERRAAYVERFRAAMEQGTGPSRGDDALPEVQDFVLPGGGLADRSLVDARVRERFGVTVLAVVRGDGLAVSNPPPETVLRAGDRLRLFGLPAQIATFRAAAAATDAGAP